MATTSYADQAKALREQAARAYNKGDVQADRGNDVAAVRAWQEGRRLDAEAARYEELAAR